MITSVYAEHVPYADAWRDALTAKQRVLSVSDDVAATLAAAWQSPGAHGSVLAALASGAQFDTDELLADIRTIDDPVVRKAMELWLFDLTIRIEEALED